MIGAGVIGAACARELSRRGVEVLVLERGAAASGTSAACEGNILVSDKSPGPELDLSLHAVARWVEVAAQIADEHGPSIPAIEFEQKGGVVVACSDAGASALATFTASQRRAGVEVHDLDPRRARGLEPDLTPQVVAAAHYPQDAQVQPTVATEALLASARASGATVLTNAPVVAVIERPDGSVGGVRTPHGIHEADAVVNAAGPWAGDVSALFGCPLPVLPRRGMVLVTMRMPHRIFHKVYDADYVGATQSGNADLQTSTVVESTASGTVLIGSSRQRLGFDDRFDVDVAAEIAAKAVAIFPFLRDASLLRGYVGFRPYMPDHLPLIGPDPRRPGLFHVTGHEGAGIGLSVVSADLLAALVTHDETSLDPRPFALDRPSLAAHLGVVV